MERISLEAAQGRHWDIVIGGTSFAAMFFARALPPELDILFVEKGNWRSHADQVLGDWHGDREQVVQRNTSGRPKDWLMFSLFGGNSNYWWGDTPRMHPDDFIMRTKFGVGVDWPLGYGDLDPWWQRAEALIEVAGGGSEHILPRSAPFPFGPHRLSRSDAALQASSDLWVPLPSARSNGGSRPACCANGVCRLCPSEAKFTVLNGLPRLEHPRAHLLLETEVRAVETAAGRGTGLVVRGRDGTEARIGAGACALGTNAVGNAAILLRSVLGGDDAGRYLHEEASVTVAVDTATIRNYYGGTSETLHGYHFYHGIDRSDAAAVLMENSNSPPQVRPVRGKWTNRMQITLIADDLPQPQNRVVLEGDVPVIEWTGHHNYALRGIERAVAGLPGLIPDELEAMDVSELLASQAHIQGTHRMGADPATSVVDDRLRLHGLPNVFVLGSGAFPTCSPANPSLTIAALSLRAGEVLA